MKKLAIVCSHPVQYHSPIFREITIRDRVTLKVFYTQSIDTAVFDRGFDQEVSWDIPLLEGYNYEFVKSGTRVANQNLVQSIKEWAPNAILVFGWSIPGHLAVMRFFKGRVPVWFRGDSTLLNETFGIRKVIRRLYLTWVYHFVDHAFYVGSNNKEYFLKHGLSENQLSFAPHAIDNERFGGEGMQDYERVAKEWRYSLGIQDNDFVVLYAGKFEFVKNLKLLIEAIIEINTNVSSSNSIFLILAGSGILENELKLKANNNKIHFIGFQNQSRMPVVYRLGDLFCLPSSSETWGLAVNEALASSRSVITSTKVGCAVDLIEGRSFGLTFDSSSLKELVNAILSMKERIQSIDATALQSEISQFISNWSFAAIVNTLEHQLHQQP